MRVKQNDHYTKRLAMGVHLTLFDWDQGKHYCTVCFVHPRLPVTLSSNEAQEYINFDT